MLDELSRRGLKPILENSLFISLNGWRTSIDVRINIDNSTLRTSVDVRHPVQSISNL